jgi:hypothetical protein
VITPADIGGDEDTARRILVRARSIAPCINSFAEGSEEKKDAVAILKGVLAELPATGSKRTKSMSRNGTSLSFEQIASAFDADSITELRSLCNAEPQASLPLGSFPEGNALGRVWPEGAYS